MLSLFKALLVLALLAVPLVIVVGLLPRLLDLAGTMSQPTSVVVTPTLPSLARAAASTPSTARSRLVVDDGPPPTLAPPEATPPPAPAARPTPTGERIVIGNTGGRGAVLRAEPVTGAPVAALHDQQVLEVLEHRDVPGGGDWVRVRTADGAEGWVTGLVARPVPSVQPQP